MSDVPSGRSFFSRWRETDSPPAPRRPSPSIPDAAPLTASPQEDTVLNRGAQDVRMSVFGNIESAQPNSTSEWQYRLRCEVAGIVSRDPESRMLIARVGNLLSKPSRDLLAENKCKMKSFLRSYPGDFSVEGPPGLETVRLLWGSVSSQRPLPQRVPELFTESPQSSTHIPSFTPSWQTSVRCEVAGIVSQDPSSTMLISRVGSVFLSKSSRDLLAENKCKLMSFLLRYPGDFSVEGPPGWETVRVLRDTNPPSESRVDLSDSPPRESGSQSEPVVGGFLLEVEGIQIPLVLVATTQQVGADGRPLVVGGFEPMSSEVVVFENRAEAGKDRRIGAHMSAELAHRKVADGVITVMSTGRRVRPSHEVFYVPAMRHLLQPSGEAFTLMTCPSFVDIDGSSYAMVLCCAVPDELGPSGLLVLDHKIRQLRDHVAADPMSLVWLKDQLARTFNVDHPAKCTGLLRNALVPDTIRECNVKLEKTFLSHRSETSDNDPHSCSRSCFGDFQSARPLEERLSYVSPELLAHRCWKETPEQRKVPFRVGCWGKSLLKSVLYFVIFCLIL